MSVTAKVRTKCEIEYSWGTAYMHHHYEILAELLEVDTIEMPYDWWIPTETVEEAINKTDNEEIKEILKTWLELAADKDEGIYVDWF